MNYVCGSDSKAILASLYKTKTVLDRCRDSSKVVFDISGRLRVSLAIGYFH
jgi:hypothetical protein